METVEHGCSLYARHYVKYWDTCKIISINSSDICVAIMTPLAGLRPLQGDNQGLQDAELYIIISQEDF